MLWHKTVSNQFKKIMDPKCRPCPISGGTFMVYHSTGPNSVNNTEISQKIEVYYPLMTAFVSKNPKLSNIK